MRKTEHLHFNLLNFFLFKDSKGTGLFSQIFRQCPLLIVVPYILGIEVVFLRKRRFFVELKGQFVGMFVVSEKPEALYISSLGVSSAYRRIGIATYIVDSVDKMRGNLRKEWLELSVVKTNAPALKLYKKLGFKKKKEKKWTLILRKRSNPSS